MSGDPIGTYPNNANVQVPFIQADPNNVPQNIDLAVGSSTTPIQAAYNGMTADDYNKWLMEQNILMANRNIEMSQEILEKKQGDKNLGGFFSLMNNTGQGGPGGLSFKGGGGFQASSSNPSATFGAGVKMGGKIDDKYNIKGKTKDFFGNLIHGGDMAELSNVAVM